MADIIAMIIIFIIGIIIGMVWKTYDNEDDRNALAESVFREDLLKHEKESLERSLDKAVKAFEDLSGYLKETPEDCKLGPWCGTCQYSKMYSRFIGSPYRRHMDAFYCGKNEACNNYIQDLSVEMKGEKT